MSLYLAILIICFNVVTIKAGCTATDVAIKSTSGELYLGVTDSAKFQLQEYDGSLSQLWRIDCGHMPGLFRLYNHEHG